MDLYENLDIDANPEVLKLLGNYPDKAKKRLMGLRYLILSTADESEEISQIEETLKWGEPSYLTSAGSTIRMDWKPKNPEHYSIYFKCTSKLVPTFRAVYGDLFKFESNRAIFFEIDEDIPVPQLKACIKAALCYHKVKHLDQLGMHI